MSDHRGDPFDEVRHDVAGRPPFARCRGVPTVDGYLAGAIGEPASDTAETFRGGVGGGHQVIETIEGFLHAAFHPRLHVTITELLGGVSDQGLESSAAVDVVEGHGVHRFGVGESFEYLR